MKFNLIASKQWQFKLVALFASSLLSFALAEVALRVCFSKSFAPDSERNLMYRYDQTLGWFPQESAYGHVVASRTISITNNSKGFRGRLPANDGKPSIMFLGDSFVWGFDVEDSERFTDKLQARHLDWNVYNCGVAGYGTDQEYLLIKRCFDDYSPSVVMLIFCSDNDDRDNLSNLAPGGYYKPYFTTTGGTLQLMGVPVPMSERVLCAEHPILRRSCVLRLFFRAYAKLRGPAQDGDQNLPGMVTGALIHDIQKYVNQKGSVFTIGVQGPHLQLEHYLQTCEIPYVDLTTFSPSDRYEAFGKHWTPSGHDFVASRIEAFLLNGHYLGHTPF